MSTYTHTSPESASFTASLYSYFSLTIHDAETAPLSGRFHFSAPQRAVYTFTLSSEDPWAQLILQGNLVKLSTVKPQIFRAIVPCFEARDFVRLKREDLNRLVGSEEGEMIWVNGRREVGVYTRVIARSVLDMEEEFGRQMRFTHGVPMYTIQQEGAVKYTLAFDLLAMKTGFVT